MRVHQMDYEAIQYTPCAYDQKLEDSLIRIGCSFPLHVKIKGDTYVCMDGRKRLSALHALAQQGKLESNRRLVPAMIINEGDLRSVPHHGMRNHH